MHYEDAREGIGSARHDLAIVPALQPFSFSRFVIGTGCCRLETLLIESQNFGSSIFAQTRRSRARRPGSCVVLLRT
jgi:hypothetical protein